LLCSRRSERKAKSLGSNDASATASRVEVIDSSFASG
jgi:hypothetical protein